MTEQVQLSACPFCGDAPFRNGRTGKGGVFCRGKESASLAHYVQVYGANQAEADLAWNTRATLQRQDERVRELEAVWQPIETAPRDGTSFVGGYFNQPWRESHREGRIVQCWFQPEFEAFISSCREMTMAPGYTINGKSRELHSPEIEDVTHWMPLPTPPATLKDTTHE